MGLRSQSLHIPIGCWLHASSLLLAESHRVVAFDSYGFGLSERNDSFKYGHALWTQQAIDVLDALEIEVPVLQMHGTLDKSQTIESARELSSRLADTRFVAIEGSDHFIHIEAPDQWVQEVATFVESLPP